MQSVCCSHFLSAFTIEEETAQNRWFKLLQHTWMLQQLPLAAVLYACGGSGWVVWVVQQLKRAGWVSRTGLPRDESQREDIVLTASVDVPVSGG